MTLRKLLFWVHLGVGLSIIAVVFVMSVTGVALTYQPQIVYWFDTHAFRAGPPSPGASRMTPGAIVDAVRIVYRDAPVTTLTLREDGEAPAEVGVGRRTVFVNPYDGRVWGEASERPRAFFRLLTAWHRALGAPGRDGTLRHTIAAACNLALLFMIGSGLILWWPPVLSRRTLANIAWFRSGLPAKARDFNWHHVFGFWCAIPLFVIVLGGVVMSYTWAGNLVFHIVGEAPEARRGGPPRGPQAPGERSSSDGRTRGGRGGRERVDVDAARIDAWWQRAEQQVSGWQSLAIRLPPAPDGVVEFTVEQGTSGQPQKRSTLTLDGRTGSVVSWARFSDRSLGGRLRTYLRFSHTGEAWGWAGQTIAGIASLAAAVLAWTGLSLAWRRLMRRTSRRLIERPMAASV